MSTPAKPRDPLSAVDRRALRERCVVAAIQSGERNSDAIDTAAMIEAYVVDGTRPGSAA